MIADLIKFARNALTEGLLMLSARQGVSVNEHRELIRKAVVMTPGESELISELLRLEPYARRVLADRYWLEDALERKDEVMSFLDQRRGPGAAHGALLSAFAPLIALPRAAPRLPSPAADT